MCLFSINVKHGNINIGILTRARYIHQRWIICYSTYSYYKLACNQSQHMLLLTNCLHFFAKTIVDPRDDDWTDISVQWELGELMSRWSGLLVECTTWLLSHTPLCISTISGVCVQCMWNAQVKGQVTETHRLKVNSHCDTALFISMYDITMVQP